MRASVVTRALAIEGVEHVMWLAPRRSRRPQRGNHLEPAPRRAALLSGRAARGFDAALNWSVEGPPAVIDAAVQDGRLKHPRLPGRARPRMVGAHLPDLREVLLSAARATSSSTGAARRTSAAAAMARCTPGLARGARALRGGDSRSRVRLNGRSATSPRSCWGTSDAPEAGPPQPSLAHGVGALQLNAAVARPAHLGAPPRCSGIGCRPRAHPASTAAQDDRPPSRSTSAEAPVRCVASDTPPAGRRLSADRVLDDRRRPRRRCAPFAASIPAPTLAPT